MNDGDKALTVAEPIIIEAAKRECADVVPLYYIARKGLPSKVSPETMYEGMMNAWKGGNIGEISNNITKIWNSTNPDVEAVKILCAENNYVIDYAKTLYKPTRPPEWDDRLRSAVKGKVPYFFQFAKDKRPQQVEPLNDSVVNKLNEKIHIYKFDFKKRELGTFDYKMLMRNKKIHMGERDREIITRYEKLSRVVGQRNLSAPSEDNNYSYMVKQIRNQLLELGELSRVVDVLVKHLFHNRKAKRKAVFWDCFGEEVLANICNNMDWTQIQCEKCGARFTPTNNVNKYCPECKPRKEVFDPCECNRCGQLFLPTEQGQSYCPICAWALANPVKTDRFAVCVDCGTPFDISTKGRHGVLCGRCKKEHNKIRVARFRAK